MMIEQTLSERRGCSGVVGVLSGLGVVKAMASGGGGAGDDVGGGSVCSVSGGGSEATVSSSTSIKSRLDREIVNDGVKVRTEISCSIGLGS